MLGQPLGIPCRCCGVAADHDHGPRGHLGNGGQGRLVAALAGRVYDDHVGTRTLGGELGGGCTGILAAEVRSVRVQTQPRGGLLRALDSLRHDLNAD